MASTYFETAMSAKSPGPGRAPSIGRTPAGSGATSTLAPLHCEHAILGRTCSITLSCAGTFSSSWVRCSPICTNSALQHEQCVSSGRRTFITNAARKISLVGGSLKDVMMLDGHSNLSTTSLYIVEDEEAKRKVVDLIFKGV